MTRVLVVEDDPQLVRSPPSTRAPTTTSPSPSAWTNSWPGYGPPSAASTNYLRVYMAQLRRKLEGAPSSPRYLITEPRMGYRFEG